MHAQHNGFFPTRDPDATTIIVDGYGASIQVEHGQLSINDGLGEERRALLLARATTKAKRILVLATTGIVSLSALQWCERLGIELVAINRDGGITMQAGPPGKDDTRLRRAQALAPFNETGVALAQFLIGRKVRGQRDVLTLMAASQASALPERTDDTFRKGVASLKEGRSIEACQEIEKKLAVLYWRQWSGIPVRWKGSREKVPEHWRTMGSRGSPRSRKGRDPRAPKSRDAITPANAVLNYCYRLAEIETVIALRLVGLDPGLGVVHTDKPLRASMALDCLEAIRPAVDLYVYRLLASRTFDHSDFHELPDGVCRIRTTLAHELAMSLPYWRTTIMPVVERVMSLLQPSLVERTPLTNRNKRRVLQKMHSPTGKEAQRLPSGSALLGEALLSSHELWTVEYLSAVQRTSTAFLASATGLSASYIRQIQAGIHVPNHRHWSAFRRAIDAPNREIRMRTDTRQADRERWTTDILPSLYRLPTNNLADRTGFSTRYIAKIKAGTQIPSSEHFPTFEQIIR